ncbi:MAG: cytidine deaminase [Bacilli bacterium]|nr:cytidine deaminase [Bacilli bacterium]
MKSYQKKECNIMDKNQLIIKAKEARSLSYSPYSHFAVGAAVLTKDGKVFVGANIENSSYPLCMCAERNALYNAMLNGYKKEDLVALALSADTDEPCSPCGACRQVISELFPKNAPIYMSNLKGDEKETTIEELLPFAFSGDDLK